MGTPRGRSRFSRSAKGEKGDRGAKKAEKKVEAPPPPPVLEGAIPAVCSECFGDYFISTKTQKDRITCPTCGHVGLIEEDTFEQIHRGRQSHKRNFFLALAATTIGFLLILAYGILNSWVYAGVVQKDPVGSIPKGDETINMVVLSAGLLLLVVSLFLVVRYEKSRVEVYF